jgi:hypothetical protein
VQCIQLARLSKTVILLILIRFHKVNIGKFPLTFPSDQRVSVTDYITGQLIFFNGSADTVHVLAVVASPETYPHNKSKPAVKGLLGREEIMYTSLYIVFNIGNILYKNK